MALEYDFEQSLFYWVCMTARAFERALNEELTPQGITFPQWQVLGWLALEGELAQAQLAERMRIEPPTLAGILERMERDGWITRETSPQDRRKKIVRPTPRVEPVWARIAASARHVRARGTAGVSTADLECLQRVLRAVQDNLNAPEPADTPSGGHT